MATKAQATEQQQQQTNVVTITRRVAVPPTKKCARCGEVKPIERFYGKAHQSSYCAGCQTTLHRERRQKLARELRELRQLQAEQATK